MERIEIRTRESTELIDITGKVKEIVLYRYLIFMQI